MSDTPDPPVLPPRYYRDNFLRLMATVQGQYADLLTDDEQGFIDDFQQLSDQAQCLYVRLVSRVGPWFRVERLQYPEIGALAAPLAELEAQSFLLPCEGLAADEAAALFTRPELQQHLGDQLSCSPGSSKADWLQAMQDSDWSEAELLQALVGEAPSATVVMPMGGEVVALLELLFFGNRRQGMTDFVLSDLGLFNYHPYPLDRSHRLFENRAAIEEYQVCGELTDICWQLESEQALEQLPELAQSLLEVEGLQSATAYRWDRLRNRMARSLERLGELDLALALYQQSGLHPARERQLRVLERGGEAKAGLELAQDILAEPWCEAERDAAQRVLPRLQRSLGQAARKRPRDNFQRLDLCVPRDEQAVEILAAAALGEQWQQVYYVENSLFNTLFGLAFWEVIFAPVPGAFVNPFQDVPLDMYRQDFAEPRQALIAERWQQLASADLQRELPAIWQQYYGRRNRWVHWGALNETLLQQALAVFDFDTLSVIWQRQLFDPRENRNGFPDLLALGARDGQDSDYCLIEVKGPGDALQDNQKRWLRCFQAESIPAAVAWVSWQDD